MKDEILKVLRDDKIDKDVKKEFLKRAPAWFGDDPVDYSSPDVTQGRKKTYKNEASITPDASLMEQMMAEEEAVAQPEVETKTTQVTPADVSGIKTPDYSKEKQLADESMKRQQENYNQYGQKMDEYFGKLDENYGERAEFGKQEYNRLMAEAQEKENLKNKYVMDYQSAVNDWNNTKIIPMRALARTSTGMMLGLAVAQAVATISGDEKSLDRLQKMIDDKIDRDIKLQEFEIKQKGQKASNILTMMKLVVPEDPSVLKNQAREVYNNHLIMEAEKLKQRASGEEMKLKLSQLQEGLYQKNQELKLEYDKAAQEAINKKAELAYKYGSKTETKVKTGSGEGMEKRTSTDDANIVASKNAMSALRNIEKHLAETKGKAFEGNLPLSKLLGKAGFTTKLRGYLDTLKNEAIKAQTGTQTEGDAERIIAELEGRSFDTSGEFLTEAIPRIARSLMRTLIEKKNSNKLPPKDKKLLAALVAKYGSPDAEIIK